METMRDGLSSQGPVMIRRKAARWLALGSVLMAAGCKSAASRQPVAPPLPESIMPAMPAPIPGGPMPSGPGMVATPGGINPIVVPRPFVPKDGPELPMPKPIDAPEASATPSTKKDGPNLPPILPPRDLTALIPPPRVETPAPSPPPVNSSDIVPIPAEGVKLPRNTFVSASKEPSAPVTLSVITPPRDTSVKPVAALPLVVGQRFGKSSDYKWVAGELDRHVRTGQWTLRFADSGEDDPWGGKVRLDDPRLKDFQSGDIVYLEGELLAPTTAASGSSTYPPYRIVQLKLIEKGR